MICSKARLMTAPCLKDLGLGFVQFRAFSVGFHDGTPRRVIIGAKSTIVETK